MNKQEAGYELVTRIQRYLDRNRMVKPQESWDTAGGNGLYYSAVFLCLLRELNSQLVFDAEFYGDWYRYLVYSCSKAPGVIMRNPEGSFGQTSHDDYMGIIVACILLKEKTIPRKILWHGCKHFGFYNTTEHFTWSAFLWRFPQIPLLLIPASFPWTKWIMLPGLYLLSRFQNLAAIGASATQLIWVYHCGCKGLGFKFAKYDRVTKLLPEAFESYYSPQHPHIEAVRSIQ